jgi:hypothetical protein
MGRPGDPEIRRSGDPEIRRSRDPEIRRSGDPEIWRSGDPGIRRSGEPEIRRLPYKAGNKEFLIPGLINNIDGETRRSGYIRRTGDPEIWRLGDSRTRPGIRNSLFPAL